MLISASFLSSQNVPLTLSLLNETDVDFIHIDVMDGKYVSTKSMPFSQIRHISEFTNKRLDVHLMVENPSSYIKDYANLNTEYITIHYEIEEDLIQDFKLIKSYGLKSGLAISPDTDIEEVVPYLPYIDLILVLGVYPGKGGQTFLDQTVNRLIQLQKLLDSYPQFSISVSVDGGININTISKVRDYVNIVVSGSFITNSSNYQETINFLR